MLSSLCAALLALQLSCPASIAFAQSRIPLVAVLIHGTEAGNPGRVAAFREGMRELGHAEGRTYRMELRWTDNQVDRLPGLAHELLQLKPDVAVAAPVISAQALSRESRTVPIVMATGAGAVRAGLIASLARPGGNVTGITNQGDELTQKHFQLLKEIAPRATRVMALSSGQGVAEPDVRSESRAAAKSYGMTLIEALADSPDKIRQLPALCARERCEAMVVLLDPTLTSQRADVIAFAAKLRLPTVYYADVFVEAGGLVSYSAEFLTNYRRAAAYVDKILKGAKAADLPVEQPTKFMLVVNMKTAKALGIKIPSSILSRADKVIE